MSTEIHYPSFRCRTNYNVCTYAEIACENYYFAKKYCLKIKEDKYSVDSLEDVERLRQHMLITVVFSHMTIEAFLNDYAAACLGDEEYYGSFDKLSAVDKLTLIVKFIFRTELDKNQSYYNCLNKLAKDRNELVHSKSKESDINYSDDEMFEIEDIQKDFSSYSSPQEVHEIFSPAHNAIKAMKEIASFFDKHDNSAQAAIRLFPDLHFYSEKQIKRDFLDTLSQDFQIKVSKDLIDYLENV